MLRARIRLVLSLFTVSCLFALDFRDVYYKLHLLGPYNTYSFTTAGVETVEADPIPKPIQTINQLQRGDVTAASAWPSFFSRCESMHASFPKDTRAFQSTLAKNCTLDVSKNLTVTLPQLLLTASVRVDSVLWVTCQLLFMARRPHICQDVIVTRFTERYMFPAEIPTFDDMAQPGGDQEANLFRFLDLMSLSFPLDRIVCVEGIILESGDRGIFTPTIYGCASPNIHQSEWIGFSHPAVSKFLAEKGWLTVDVVALMGNRFGIRQNSINTYEIDYAVESGQMILTPKSRQNFSSFGHLYVLSVVVDIMLLVAHFLTAYELLTWFTNGDRVALQAWLHDFETCTDTKIHSPIYDGLESHSLSKKSIVSHTVTDCPDAKDDEDERIQFDEALFYMGFSHSFYSTPSFVILTVLSRLLSWTVILPNSIIWTWGDSWLQKLHGHLNLARCWILIPTMVNLIWRSLVHVDERRAYAFVRGTFLSHRELLAISFVATFTLWEPVSSMRRIKYAYEHQRLLDTVSFGDNYHAYANAFDKTLADVSSTPWYIGWIIYKPLVQLVGLGTAMALVWVVCKSIVLRRSSGSKRNRSSAIYVADNSQGKNRDTPVNPRDPAPYARVPLEIALDDPIRARSLIRNALALELLKDGRLYVHPSCYLEFGVMLTHGRLELAEGDNAALAIETNLGKTV